MNLQLKNIKVRFSHKTVLENFDIFFQENKIHALLGENGAGKSTAAAEKTARANASLSTT